MSLYHDMSEFVHDGSERLFFVPLLLVRVGVLSSDAEYFMDFIDRPRDVLIEHFVLFLAPFCRLVKRTAIHRHEICVLVLVIQFNDLMKK